MKETPLDKIAPRIKYYLLDFKDLNYSRFYDWYRKEALRDLTLSELRDMFIRANEYDIIDLEQPE